MISQSSILLVCLLSVFLVLTSGDLLQPTTNTSTSTSTLGPNSSTTTNSTIEPSTVPFQTATPLPKFGQFTLSNNGTTCLLLDLDCDIKVTYKASIESVRYHLPSNAKVSGNCSSQSAMSIVTLSWSLSRSTLNLTLTFKQDGNIWKMSEVEFVANGNPLLANFTGVVEARANDSSILVKKGYSYLCEKEDSINLGSDVLLIFKSIKVQPFSDEFGEFVNCEEKNNQKDGTDNVVPLVVGCVLAGLVLILIITYCVGKHRKQHGYENM
ncbi:lysosome-associated membrane glycoprotein 1 [Nematostella vectensis]|uniref:lysosome-associated membrane glycoprotein 1 n=1 Tax=Nematostella vectensis TaxID=45351 RepID=UPI0020770CC7|nr:lysosome-associated membrane glycoprotein 1 [Nematostella vectensis]